MMTNGERLWRDLMMRSWRPSQWYEDEDPPHRQKGADINALEGDVPMWVYRALHTMEMSFAVGFYDPKGEWHEDGRFATKEQAAARVRWLNGGDSQVSHHIYDEPPLVPNTSRPIWELVVEDMKERDKVGRQRYGTPLQAHNGRDALVDAYQEALHLCVYLRQVIEERDSFVPPSSP